MQVFLESDYMKSVTDTYNGLLEGLEFVFLFYYYWHLSKIVWSSLVQSVCAAMLPDSDTH